MVTESQVQPDSDVLNALAPVDEASAATEAQTPPPAAPADEAAVGADGEELTGEAEGTEETGETWESLKARIEADETLAARFKQERDSAYIEGIEAERRNAPNYEQSIRLSRAVQGEVQRASALGERIASAIESIGATRNPDLIDPLRELFQSDARIVSAINALGNARSAESLVRHFDTAPSPSDPTHGQRLAALGIGAVDEKGHYQVDIAALPDLVQSQYYLITRGIVEEIAKEVGAPGILRDFLSSQEPVGSSIKKAIAAAAAHAKKQGTTLSSKRDAEIRKGENRDGAGPNTAARGAGGGLIDPDTIPTNTWITMPMEDRERIKSRWAEHVARRGQK